MHKYNSLIPFIFSALVLVGCSKEPKDHLVSGESHLSFTENGAWCWFSDPRAIFYKGRTYAGWVDSLGNTIVGYYDHKTRYIETRVLHENLEVDDHDNPSLFIDRDGKLMVFYSKHSGSEPIYLLRATRPEDISQWEELDELKLNDTIAYQGLSDTYTYTNICQLADENNKLYLFWRGADYKPNVSVSMDNGKNWDAGKILVLPERIYKDRRPYMKVASNNKDVIHFAFTDGHPNREFTNSIYYAKYQNGSFYKANGEKIADWSQLPLSPPLTDVAYDAKLTNEKAWIWDIAENKEGDPVLVYSRFPTDSAHVYYYSVWSENKWNHHELINSGHWFPETPAGKVEREPNYSGGIVLDHGDPSIVYLSVKRNGIFEIEKWTTGNKGNDWNMEAITSNSKSNNVRPFVIRNHESLNSPSVLWMNVEKYVHYTDYQTSIKMNVK